MSVMAQPWKNPQSGVYYFRREVPESIRGIIGRREWKFSLKTRELTEARPRFADRSRECEEVFAAARDQLAGKSRLLLSDAPKLADHWAQSVIDSWESHPDSVSDFLVRDDQGYSAASDFIDTDNENARVKLVTPFITETLNERRLPIPPSAEPVWRVLVVDYFRRWVQLCHLAADRAGGNWRSAIELPLSDKPLSMEQARLAATHKGPKLSTIFERWKVVKFSADGKTRSTLKTAGDFGNTITRFIELFGDLPVNQITAPLVHDFYTALCKLPTKGKGLRGLTVPELIAKAEKEGLPTAALRTTRKQLRALSTILSLAKNLGYISVEPVSGTGLIQRLGKAAERADTTGGGGKEYSLSELLRIFKSPIYTEGWAPRRADYGQAFYWLPLLMIYTGARREELAQLAVDDVQRDEPTNIYCMYIRPGNDRMVKNANSIRRFPLHPDLLALGLLEYKESLPADGRLFPQLSHHPQEGYGHNFGKLWAKYLREVVKLETKASPAHGFRHSFKTLCREAAITTDVHDWITGHATVPKNVGGTYGSQPLQRMNDELLKFPSIAREAGLLNTC